MNLIVYVGKGIVKLRSTYSAATTMCKELKTNVLRLLPQSFNGPSAEHDSRPGQVFTEWTPPFNFTNSNPNLIYCSNKAYSKAAVNPKYF